MGIASRPGTCSWCWTAGGAPGRLAGTRGVVLAGCRLVVAPPAPPPYVDLLWGRMKPVDACGVSCTANRTLVAGLQTLCTGVPHFIFLGYCAAGSIEHSCKGPGQPLFYCSLYKAGSAPHYCSFQLGAALRGHYSGVYW
ncbi:hypothetical protein PGIGA_G00212140 [Pangasianodon gigas]|uniref:Uncharacterized protein n=1 Tax=Pangasianodon gigas TaxID=30993 RepID=A0ACC5WHE1_PANGG|nr:hypothetical protein [Pangasianodon gigas]